MTADTYKQAFERALEELAEVMEERDKLDTQREEMDKRISTLRDGLLGLSALAGVKSPQTARPDLFPDLIDPDLGITEAVKKVLVESEDYLSPVAVRDGLERIGFDVKKYKNALASIHQILKRLAESGTAAATTREGKTLYKWNLPRIKVPVPGKMYGGGSAAGKSATQRAIDKLHP